jgi:hypothetical protein
MRLTGHFGLAITSALAGLASAAVASPPVNPLVVHEWGTFTTLENEQGKQIGGINTDDEPVPAFVHDLHAELQQSRTEVPPVFSKGWPRCDQDVYVRLETPVIYFHLPPGSQPVTLDVNVQMNGGWLTQFYPDARASAPGLRDEKVKFGRLTDATVGKLSWDHLTIGTHRSGPTTDQQVWTSPRQVDAADVTTAAGESERYLFYRGVAHIGAPFSVSHDASGEKLEVRADWSKLPSADRHPTVGPLWLMDIRADGTSAMREIAPIEPHGESKTILSEIPANFASSDYSSGNLAAVRRAMKESLVHEGLFADEADALLNTWQAAYFKRPGMRLFFLVPAAWTQHYLPLHFSRAADVTRVMVGRIELVTPHQRELLRKIATGPASKADWAEKAFDPAKAGPTGPGREEFYARLWDGRQSLRGLNLSMPDDYRAYLDLGRFRNALVLDEVRQHPSPSLTAFIKNYGLGT